MKNKILVAGLPRAGTTSIGKALENIGYKVLHYCPLTNDDLIGRGAIDYLDDKIIEEYNCLVSWRATPRVHDFIKKGFTHCILCTRSEGWELSCLQFGFTPNTMEDMKEDLYHAYCHCLFSSIPCTNFDISKHGYKEICHFLEINPPNIPFPHYNKSEGSYEI